MRATITGFFFGILFCGIALVSGDIARHAVAGGLEATPETVTVFSSADGRQVTLVDKSKQVFCIYHIDAKNGDFTLKSVRSYRWDLELEHFNGTDPLPDQIRSMLDR